MANIRKPVEELEELLQLKGVLNHSYPDISPEDHFLDGCIAILEWLMGERSRRDLEKYLPTGDESPAKYIKRHLQEHAHNQCSEGRKTKL